MEPRGIKQQKGKNLQIYKTYRVCVHYLLDDSSRNGHVKCEEDKNTQNFCWSHIKVQENWEDLTVNRIILKWAQKKYVSLLSRNKCHLQNLAKKVMHLELPHKDGRPLTT